MRGPAADVCILSGLPTGPSGAAEAEQAERQNTDTAAFLRAATKDVYGTTQGGSLEDTVGRRAFFNERREGGGSAFRKHG